MGLKFYERLICDICGYKTNKIYCGDKVSIFVCPKCGVKLTKNACVVEENDKNGDNKW